MDELERAARELSVWKEEADVGNEKLGDEDSSGSLFSKVGLTWEQAQNEDLMLRLTAAFISGINHNIPIGNLVHGTWLDGVCVGILVERNRRKENDGD